MYMVLVGAGSSTIIVKNRQSRKSAPTQRKIPTYIFRCDANSRLMWAIGGGGRVYLDCWYSLDIVGGTRPYQIWVQVLCKIPGFFPRKKCTISQTWVVKNEQKTSLSRPNPIPPQLPKGRTNRYPAKQSRTNR